MVILAESKKTYRSILHVFLALALLTAFSGFASADVGFSEFRIELDDDTLDLGDPLRIAMDFEDPNNGEPVDVELEILIDDITVFLDENYEINFVEDIDKTVDIDSDDFPGPDLDSDFWEDNLMDYMCGEHTVTVLLSGSDLDDDLEDSEEFEIDGRELFVSLDPEEPLIDDDLTVTATDDDGDEVRSATVKVTWIDDPDVDVDGEWDGEDDKWTGGRTDSDGEEEFDIESKFDDDSFGRYQIDVYEEDYCLVRKTIDVTNKLNVTVSNKKPQAGDSVNICVRDAGGTLQFGANLYVYKRGGGYSKTLTTQASGCRQFTLTDSGTYSVSATKSGYQENVDNEITVGEKEKLEVTPSVTPAATGTEITFTVRSESGPVEGVEVSVNKEGGSQTVLPDKTGAGGTVSYTAGDSGTYTVTAEHENYESATNTFTVENSFMVSAPSQPIPIGQTASITVKNSMGDPVEAADVKVIEAEATGKTDALGGFSFTVTEAGEYLVVVEKQDYAAKTVTLQGEGQLKAVAEKQTVEVGDTSKITVTDSGGIKKVAEITVTKPSGKKLTASGQEYDFKGDEIGSYSISASKRFFKGAQTSIEVVPRDLEINVDVDSELLKINATSHGETVPNLPLTVMMPNGSIISVDTNEFGIALLSMGESGNYTINSADEGYLRVSKVVVNQAGGFTGFIVKIVAALVVVLALIVLILGAASLSKKGLPIKKKKKSSFDDKNGKGTRLGGI